MATVPSMMKAAVVVKHKDPMVLKEVPVKEAGPGDVVVKILVSGVCHTDVHVNDGDWDVPMTVPRIAGHEGCGVVVKLGAGAEKYVKIGDRVGVPWLHAACGECYDCRDGWETVCQKSLQTGFTVDGGFAQYVVARADFVHKIPDGVSFEQAAPVMCAGVTVYKALKVSECKPGQWVVISGAAGGLGHVACQYAKAMGMKVIGMSRKFTAEKQSMLNGFAVDYCLDLSKESAEEGVKKATGGHGAHAAICLAPTKDDVDLAVKYVRPRGTVVPVALPDAPLTASGVLVVVKAIRIIGSIVGTRNDLEEAMRFAAEGKVKCMVAKRKFEEINDVIGELRQGKIQGRVVLEMPQ